MKKPQPPSRIGTKRRAVGWTLLTLGVIVAGVWVASGWWEVTLAYSDKEVWNLEVQAGCLCLEPRFMQPGGIPRYVDREKWWWSGWTRVSWASAKPTRILPLWPIPLLLWTPAALLLRSGILARRRAAAGSCAKCGYSLAGLAQPAACPECGKGAAAG